MSWRDLLFNSYKCLKVYVLASFVNKLQFSSVQFSCSVVSNSLRPHELQHARPPCPSPTPGVHSDSRPSSQWSIQPSHPLSSPSPALNPSQHQSLFKWVSSMPPHAEALPYLPWAPWDFSWPFSGLHWESGESHCNEPSSLHTLQI